MDFDDALQNSADFKRTDIIIDDNGQEKKTTTVIGSGIPCFIKLLTKNNSVTQTFSEDEKFVEIWKVICEFDGAKRGDFVEFDSNDLFIFSKQRIYDFDGTLNHIVYFCMLR